MRKQYIEVLIILSCLASLSITNVRGQSKPNFEIRIPFDFVVPGGTLRAGDYAVDRADPTRPNTLKLKNTKTGRVQVFIIQRVETDDVIDESCLIFKRSRDQYRLFQVWVVGSKDGSQVPGSENRRGQNGTVSLIRLKGNESKP